MQTSKKILLVAFDFTPSTSPGVERVLKFAQYLQGMGWEPIVLTVLEKTYNKISNESVEHKFPIYRTFCTDVSKHLAYKGRYFGWMKQPDRYWGWCFTAIPKGIKLVKKYKVDVVFSSYPILTSHIIAGVIAKRSKLPWVADYRDPLQCYYHKEVYKSSKIQRLIDRWVVKNCQKAIFATDSAAALYRGIHAKEDAAKFTSIYNGVDSNNFCQQQALTLKNNKKFVLLHTGSLYASGRDPSELFLSLMKLKKQGCITEDNFLVRLRGENNEFIYGPQVRALGISELVEFAKSIPYRECLKEMQQVDALLLIQGDIFFSQIPGKIYEYFATGKKILAITSEKSETALLAKSEEGCFVENESLGISRAILKLLDDSSAVERNIQKYERKHRAAELAELLNHLTSTSVTI